MSEELQDNLKRLYRDYLVDHGDLGAESDHLNIRGEARARLESIVTELKARRHEALSLYKPLPKLAGVHKCGAPERVVRGSNRSGKTVIAAVECARIVTGQDPYKKLPAKDGRCWIVGKDGRHNSEVLYRKLFRFGAFKIIQILGRTVAFDPTNPLHAKLEHMAKPAPPLIPPRFIKEIAWEMKKESLPSLVTLTNGWEIRLCSSQGKPPNGIDAHYIWFDEEISDGEWYPEMAARLVDHSGLFLWSATAQLGGYQLFDLCERAAKEKRQPTPTVVEFFAHIDDNIAFSDKQREAFWGKLTDEQRRIRIDGEFAFTQQLVYPEFSLNKHGAEWFEIPSDWTRYMLVDPGRQVCAVLFAAVPPPSDERHAHVYFYDELYIRNCDAKTFGERVRDRTMGQNFHAFIIDHQGARVTDTGGGLNIEMQYSAELKKHGVKSRATGYHFQWGANDVTAGIEAFRSWLLTRGDGTTKLQFFKDKMPEFAYEGTRYRYKRVKGDIQPKPEKRDDHLMDLCRYAAMHDLKWAKPRKRITTPKGLLDHLKRKRDKKNKSAGVNLGPTNHEHARQQTN